MCHITLHNDAPTCSRICRLYGVQGREQVGADTTRDVLLAREAYILPALASGAWMRTTGSSRVRDLPIPAAAPLPQHQRQVNVTRGRGAFHEP
jgi:hypothetical protein